MRDLENAIVGWTFRALAPFVVTALASAACTREAGTGSTADTVAASVGAKQQRVTGRNRLERRSL